MEKGIDEKGQWIKVYVQPEFKTPTNWRKVKPNWNNYFYFRDSKKTKALLPPDINGSISSVVKFHDDYFYKVQSLSNKDPVFDYYRKKKDGIDPSIKNFGKGVIPRLRRRLEEEETKYKYENKSIELCFN